jgi:diguanylate cyclase (GGDEF)-like protein
LQSKTELFLIRLLSRRTALPQLIFAIILSTAAIGLLDYLTPRDLSLTFFYIIPVAVAALLAGPVLGYSTAVLSAAVWAAAALLSGRKFSSVFYFAWDTLLRAAYNAVSVYLICALRDLIENLRELTLRDPLTKAANRRYFEEYLALAIGRANREGSPLTFMIFDIDDFKSINDNFGHIRGDEVLTTLSDSIQARIRPGDMLARLGGDEFAIILYAMDFARSEDVTARLLEALSRDFAAKGICATLSGGMITYTAAGDGPDEMIRKADQLMYEVKRGGKNGRKHILIAA